MTEVFVSGWFAGIVSALFFGAILRGIAVNWKRARSPGRVQVVTHTTGMSPFQVFTRSLGGCVMVLFWVGVLLAVLYALVAGLT